MCACGLWKVGSCNFKVVLSSLPLCTHKSCTSIEHIVSLFTTLRILQILHYLETLRPHQLLEQMVCTAFKAAADTLSQTSYGGLKLMKAKMEQLYCTMVSVLKFLQGREIHNLHVF